MEAETHYRKYKSQIFLLLTMTGFWSSETGQLKHTRKGLLSFFMVFQLIFYCVNCQLAELNSYDGSVVVNSIGTINDFVKITSMLVLWRDLKDLKYGLSTFFENDLQVAEWRVHLLTHQPAFHRFFKVHLYCCADFFVLGTCAMRDNNAMMQITLITIEYWPGVSLYWLIFALVAMSGACVAINTLGSDSLFGLLALQIAGELRLLSHRFGDLKPGENYRRDLKLCIDRHCLLIRYKHLINRVYGFASVCQAISCTLIVCSTILRMTRNNGMTFLQVLYGLNCATAKILQACVYAWFGNAINVESDNCSESIYYSNWIGSEDLRLKKDVLIVQSHNLVSINVMGATIVRLDMFVKIAHASLTYFSLLKNFAEELTWAD